jgi:O-methyltransferase/methyltransferase family protein
MEPSAFKIFEMLTSGQLTSNAIYIVAKLRIADFLKDGPKSIDELAKETKTHPDSLYRLLRMLSSIGIFAETKTEGEVEEHINQRRFELTPMSSLLISEAKNSVRNFALLFGLEPFRKAIDDLLYSIETGESSFRHANELDIYEYMQQNQKDAQIFNGAMTSLTSSHASSISSMYDFSQFNIIIDIGGGQGTFLSTLLKTNPKLQGILFDLPHAIESAKRLYTMRDANSKDSNSNDNDNILSRCKLIEGDFFKSIPVVNADCYIIKNVILNWDDESATVILRNCLQAIKTTSSIDNTNHTKRQKFKLLIIDTIMPESNEPFLGKFTDIIMLALTQKGRIRTEREFRKLLEDSGFDIVNIIESRDSLNFLSIIEAVQSQ